MKAKKLLTLILAVVMAAMAVVSASAATLTEDDNDGQTEVKAHINGPDSGNVTYKITIPDVIDFEELTQPADDDDDYFKYVDYTVTLTELSGLDEETQQVSVYVRDQNAKVDGDQKFWLTNKSDPTKKFKYDVFTTPKEDVTITTPVVNNGQMVSHVGYYLTGFTQQGESMLGSLRLAQVQLYGYDLLQIVGEYSGYMVFYSAIEALKP